MRQTVVVRIQVIFGVNCADLALASCEVQQILNGFAFFDIKGVRYQGGSVYRNLQCYGNGFGLGGGILRSGGAVCSAVVSGLAGWGIAALTFDGARAGCSCCIVGGVCAFVRAYNLLLLIAGNASGAGICRIFYSRSVVRRANFICIREAGGKGCGQNQGHEQRKGTLRHATGAAAFVPQKKPLLSRARAGRHSDLIGRILEVTVTGIAKALHLHSPAATRHLRTRAANRCQLYVGTL